MIGRSTGRHRPLHKLRSFVPSRLDVSPGRLAAVFGGMLVLAEGGVFVALSPVAGAALAVSTGGLAFALRDGIREQFAPRAEQPPAPALASDSAFDLETRMPTRQSLIDQLVRDLARSRRYSQDLTLAIVELTRFESFQASWGAENGRAAVQHVAETLRRVTRSSDFVARLDATRFAVVLIQCNEAQATLFGDRLSLAVSNRPLKSTSLVKLPLYVGIDVAATQYSPEKFRGPLDFLSAAGGDLLPEGETSKTPGRSRPLASDPQALRRQLVRDYYPDGKATDFADAYREHRSGARRVV